MEKLIGVQHSERNLKEPLIELQPDVKKPKYQIIDEESEFTPEVIVVFLLIFLLSSWHA
jgi:hypothetical protein